MISVVVTCYNYAQYLAEALESVLAQTYQDWECIIVDDGSTDASGLIARQYEAKDSRFQYVYQTNQGVAAARNNGIRTGRGEYVLPLDADDKIAPEYLHKAAQAIEAEPDIKVVYCEAELFGEKSGLWNLSTFSIETILRENVIFCTALFRKSDFEKTQGYDTEFKFGYEDWDFWLSLLGPGGKVYRIPEVLFSYRIKAGSRDRELTGSKANYLTTVKQIVGKHIALYRQYYLPITVIIPNYNHARYLPQRIESVLNQTYPFFEVLLMDDCSTDNSREIIKHYASSDKRIRVILNEQNSGSTFKQWNKGVKEAKGEYIWLAESDDVADESFLEKLLNEVRAHPNIGIAYCQSSFIDENGKVIGEWNTELPNGNGSRWKNNYVEKGADMVCWYFTHLNIIPNASGALIRRDKFIEVGYADEDCKLVGDWLLYVKILKDSNLLYLVQPRNYFRMHTSSVRSKAEKNGLYLEETARVLAFILVTFPCANRESALWHFMKVWKYRTLDMPIPLRSHLRAYRLLRKVDESVNRKLIKSLIHKTTPTIKVLKKIFSSHY